MPVKDDDGQEPVDSLPKESAVRLFFDERIFRLELHGSNHPESAQTSEIPHTPKHGKETHANISVLPPLNRLRRKLRIFRIDHRLLDPRSASRRSLDHHLHLAHPVQGAKQEHGFVNGLSDRDQAVVLEDAGLEFRAEGFGDVDTFFGSEDDTAKVGVDACFIHAPWCVESVPNKWVIRSVRGEIAGGARKARRGEGHGTMRQI